MPRRPCPAAGEVAQLPAVLVSPNDVTMSPAVTKFGRGAAGEP